MGRDGASAPSKADPVALGMRWPSLAMRTWKQRWPQEMGAGGVEAEVGERGATGRSLTAPPLALVLPQDPLIYPHILLTYCSWVSLSWFLFLFTKRISRRHQATLGLASFTSPEGLLWLQDCRELFLPSCPWLGSHLFYVSVKIRPHPVAFVLDSFVSSCDV